LNESIRNEFKKRGPWITRFQVDGESVGGNQFDPATDPRLEAFKRAAAPLRGKRVLELGPLEGGHTLHIAREGASVVAIEGREANYKRCLYIKELFALDNVEFMLGDLRSVDLASLGRFDAVFNVGVLYHLDEPWKLLADLAALAPGMFLWTHCAADDRADASVQVDGHTLHGMWWREGSIKDPLSGLQKRSFWPTRDGLEQMLALTGWPQVTWFDYTTRSAHGPSGYLWAERAAPVPAG
jgi:2-polyprenyl-3-methyl-5-hydroxy-6-metoxy-1,4-benzoquinol methylase